ncbi:1638_t:CDS:2 [Paraglomus brasilianum]|uniref:1638_t:CDS:1 n=1 Tax=Paraglomus brasilianum TaxID=144538 RepID=A0A9N8YUK1_9GLOM|nr:1638_t:CDS:2 [Paraglomus brasilianum]
MSRLLLHPLLHIPTSRSTLLLFSSPNFQLPPAFYLIRNQVRFSGHNKWSKIRHGKGMKDSARSTNFHRLAKDISLAVKEGGSTDPTLNVRLATAIATAKKSQMSKETIDNAIKRGAGQSKDGTSIERVTYEAYGPNGTAFIIETATDNRNRTVKEIKALLAKFGGSISEVSWIFDRKGIVRFTKGTTEDTIDVMMEKSLEIEGVEDIRELDQDIMCAPTSISAIASSLASGYEITKMRVEYIPTDTVQISGDEEKVGQFEKFLVSLNNHEDVVRFYTNAE